MIRTQIQLTPEQFARLKSLARERKISVSEMIRREIAQHLLAPNSDELSEVQRRALQAAGKFRAGAPDLSEKHDAYLGEAYGE